MQPEDQDISPLAAHIAENNLKKPKLEKNHSPYVLGSPTLFDRLPKELLEVLKRLIIENNIDICRYCWQNPTIIPGQLIQSQDNRVVTKKDKTVYVWNNGVCVAQLYNYGDGKVDPSCDSKCTKLAIPRHFAVYPNNQEIRHITEIPNNAIEIRDAINGSYITMLSACGHTLPLRLISFSNDGKKIITGAHDAAVKVWDAAHGTLLMKLEGHEHGADYAAFNCDDTMILTISNDYKARVWDASNGACKTVLGDQKDPHLATYAQFNPRGTKIATYDRFNDTIKIWDARTGACHLTFDCRTRSSEDIWYLKFMHDADRVVTQTSVALKIWNMDGTCLEFSRNDYLKLSPKAKFLAIYTDNNITIIDCLTGKTIIQRQLPNIKRICWNPQETMIATVNGNNIICIWDLKTCRATIHSDNKNRINCI